MDLIPPSKMANLCDKEGSDSVLSPLTGKGQEKGVNSSSPEALIVVDEG